MKARRIILIMLAVVTASHLQAAPRKKKAAVATTKVVGNIKPILKAIGAADVKKVDTLIQANAQMLNEHNKEFSPLGKAYSELELNQQAKNLLSRSEKTARTRQLKKIIAHLKERGATLIFDNYAAHSKKGAVNLA